jgi:hypothetical protein
MFNIEILTHPISKAIKDDNVICNGLSKERIAATLHKLHAQSVKISRIGLYHECGKPGKSGKSRERNIK